MTVRYVVETYKTRSQPCRVRGCDAKATHYVRQVGEQAGKVGACAEHLPAIAARFGADATDARERVARSRSRARWGR